jgi:hypothetical protein
MSQWQLRFDEGRQQRYFADRRHLLACVLRVSKLSPHPRFEVYAEGEPTILADGREAGRRYELVEVLDLDEPGALNRITQELESLS